MRKIILSVLLLSAFIPNVMAQCTNHSSGHCRQQADSCQHTSCQDMKPGSADVLPAFPGGQPAMKEYLDKNIKTPKMALQYGIQGQVTMRFVVDKDGSVKDITAEDCTITSCDEAKFTKMTKGEADNVKRNCLLAMAKEGARVIRKMPRWQPGERNGVKMSTLFRQKIVFRQR